MAKLRVVVPGIGTFRFRHRTLKDELRIGVEYSRLTEDVESPTKWLAVLATIIATLSVLTVRAPDGWDIEAMDPLDPETYLRLVAVHNALIAAERAHPRNNRLAA